MTHQFKIGANIVELDDQGNLVSTRTGETRMSLRPDDGITGRLPVTCPNGHEGLEAPIPPIVASLSAKSLNIETPCPFCGATVSAEAGYYVRNKDGLFERLSGMPS